MFALFTKPVKSANVMLDARRAAELRLAGIVELELADNRTTT
jgi:hypothetical protein